MELRTVEVRWFRVGPCPGTVANWFLDAPFVGEPERRTDEYLELVDYDGLGVKQRAGTVLDLKARTATLADVELPIGLDGNVEAWTKWSFPIDPTSAASVGESWISVEKTRWSRVYEVGGDGATAAVPPGMDVGDACAAELVEVRMGASSSWAFGFEAHGDELDAGRVLEETMARFVQDSPLAGLSFDMVDSHSYPSWLRRRPMLR